jgi:hypothetical protein
MLPLATPWVNDPSFSVLELYKSGCACTYLSTTKFNNYQLIELERLNIV